jgi:secondary thiamine-phosphate synthase enzyme
MDTLTAVVEPCYWRLHVATSQTVEFVDLSEQVQALVTGAGIRTGLINIQSLHTTAAVVLNEAEPLLLTDFAALLERAAPRGALYRHDDLALRTVNLSPGERVNGHAHCRALLLSASACLNVVDGRLQLGRWQRVFLVELDGPRVRDLSILCVGAGRL